MAKKILFQLSGSIAAFKACSVISQLVKAGHEVQVAVSDSALHFIGEATLEGLSARPVLKSAFEKGQMMDHIHQVRWADLLILCPASANTLNQFASGTGDSLLTTLFLAHDFKKPYLIFPAMNASMYLHPATQASVAKLKSWGVKVFDTNAGDLACGEYGEGRLLEPEQIYKHLEEYL